MFNGYFYKKIIKDCNKNAINRLDFVQKKKKIVVLLPDYDSIITR